MSIKNDVYRNINNLQRQCIGMRELAISVDVSFDESMRIRAAQDKLYKKAEFYKNIVKCIGAEDVKPRRR